MDLGQKLKQARLEAGLSQRQLCGEEITRNMLSQIENGAAHPSMATLRYLAARLGKSVSYFLEEDAVTSPNQAVMEQARSAYKKGNHTAAAEVLEQYREPDPVFDGERQLLHRLTVLALAENAAEEGRGIYAAQLLEELGTIEEGYCAGDLERRRLLLLGKLQPKMRGEICRALPSLDDELLLRAAEALDRGDIARSECLIESAERREDRAWNYLRGEIHMARNQYRAAAKCYHRAEKTDPNGCAARLERCYREMGNFERAYFYACRQREENGAWREATTT